MAKQQMMTIGFKEYVSIPAFDIVDQVAKIDTGSYHGVFDCSEFYIIGEQIHFTLRLDHGQKKRCEWPLAKMTNIKNTSGNDELRPLIEFPIMLGHGVYSLQATLAERQAMSTRILLGRQFLESRFLVDVSVSHLLSS